MSYIAYRNLEYRKGRLTCKLHGSNEVVESFPPGNLTASACRKCVEEAYNSAPVCPHCGIKAGFAPGTGDCGCEVDY